MMVGCLPKAIGWKQVMYDCHHLCFDICVFSPYANLSSDYVAFNVAADVRH